MLRIILGVTGAGLIGFGVFGGDSLEFVHGKVAGLVGDTVSAVTMASTDVAPVEKKSLSATSEKGTDKNSHQINTLQSDDAKAVLAENAEASASEQKMVAALAQDNLGFKAVTRPLKEVQASARNSEVAIARSLIDGEEVKSPVLEDAKFNSTQESVEANTSKSDSVGSVLKTSTGEPANNTLFVLKESVNLREGPSTEHPIVLRLDKGQELMEFKRDGKWVHVGAYGTSGKIGWVHNTLVGLSH